MRGFLCFFSLCSAAKFLESLLASVRDGLDNDDAADADAIASSSSTTAKDPAVKDEPVEATA